MLLVSYNIQYGFGRDGRYDLARVAAAVANADIIALQEVERNWRRSRFDDQPALLADLMPFHHYVYGPAFDMDAPTAEAGRIVHRRRQFGTMLLSRWPIRWSLTQALPMRRMLDPLNTRNAALEGQIDTPAGPVRVVSLHLPHVGVDERLDAIDLLLERHRRAAAEGGPWSGRDDEPERDWTQGEAEPASPAAAIWLGDFNCEHGSAEFRRLTGEAPYHRGARYAGALIDAALATGRTPGELHTHVKVIDGAERRRQLDHCLVSAELAPRLRRVWADNDAPGSDHHPLWIDIDLETPLAGAD